MNYSKEDILNTYSAGNEFITQIDGTDISCIEFTPEQTNPKATIVGITGGPGLPKEHLSPLSVLSDVGYKVMLYDPHNVGESTTHEDPYTIQTFKKILLTLLSEYDGEDIILAGHSWGSMLALELLTTEHPDNISGFIAMAPLFDTQENVTIAKTIRASYLDKNDIKEMHIVEQMDDTVSSHKENRYTGLVEEIDTEFGFIPPIPEFVEEQSYDRMNTEMYEEMWGPEEFKVNPDGELYDWGVKESLQTITIPTLLVTGEQDMFGYHDLYEAADKISGQTTTTILPAASHTFFWEQPVRSLLVLTNWIDKTVKEQSETENAEPEVN